MPRGIYKRKKKQVDVISNIPISNQTIPAASSTSYVASLKSEWDKSKVYSDGYDSGQKDMRRQLLKDIILDLLRRI